MTDYAIYDVFTETALRGNPLAVIHDADHLDSEAMARIAGEFNLSETVFVIKPDNPAHTARLRIFTPDREMPFAGHPTVGAAVALADRRVGGEAPGGGIDLVQVFEEAIGPVRCAVRLRAGRPGFAEFDLPQLPRRLEFDADPAEVGAALGLDPHEIGFENHRPSLWSAGVPFMMVPAHDLASVAKAECDPSLWERIAPMADGQLALPYVYCRGGVHHGAHFHARMFVAGNGVVEDPATGSAVAAMSGAIHQFDGVLDGHHALVVEQGVEMDRASLIHLHLESAGGAIVKARIGGQAVQVAEGRLLL